MEGSESRRCSRAPRLSCPIQAVAFCENGAVTVNVPSPARYALHKLLVWDERKEAHRAKAATDLTQAAALISYFKAHRAAELEETARDLLSRGKAWVSRAREGLRALSTLDPELTTTLQ